MSTERMTYYFARVGEGLVRASGLHPPLRQPLRGRADGAVSDVDRRRGRTGGRQQDTRVARAGGASRAAVTRGDGGVVSKHFLAVGGSRRSGGQIPNPNDRIRPARDGGRQSEQLSLTLWS